MAAVVRRPLLPFLLPLPLPLRLVVLLRPRFLLLLACGPNVWWRKSVLGPERAKAPVSFSEGAFVAAAAFCPSPPWANALSHDLICSPVFFFCDRCKQLPPRSPLLPPHHW